jgi:pyruvate, orthophosphate dikinase
VDACCHGTPRQRAGNGRASNPKLEVGIRGEHGGEPSPVQFCYRVPITRLAAAQAAISGDWSESQRTK